MISVSFFNFHVWVHILTPILVSFSDTDSDSSTTSSSSSCSSSTVSDEDDHPNEKDNRRHCVKTKDELPLDVSKKWYLSKSLQVACL